jgi:hypothetical protein
LTITIFIKLIAFCPLAGVNHLNLNDALLESQPRKRRNHELIFKRYWHTERPYLPFQEPIAKGERHSCKC